MQVIDLMLALVKADPSWHVAIHEEHIVIFPVEVIEETEDGAFVAIDMEQALVLCAHDEE